MIEKLNEAKALIDAGKYEEAKAKIDEVIAEVTPAPASNKGPEKIKDDDVPLPGTGSNGHI